MVKRMKDMDSYELHVRLIAAGFFIGRGIASNYIEACKQAIYTMPKGAPTWQIAAAVIDFPENFPD